MKHSSKAKEVCVCDWQGEKMCAMTAGSTPQACGLGQEKIVEMLYTGILVDGRKGGLVLGPSHEEGFIYLLQEGPSGCYGVVGTMEGGEYLLSRNAYRLFRRRIDAINAWRDPEARPENIAVSRKTRILNAFGPDCDGAIFVDSGGQFVVNRYATNRFYSEIEDLNYRGEGLVA
ncbi:MAG: hypothetical protein P4L42_09375 [Desulfocapsaceae bacterium]|nr:hypothetical protein [Desulfocapsaceae bacterium]